MSTTPVQDLATRFADGRLSTEKLIQADDEELANMLIEVRGIGRVSRRLVVNKLSANTCTFRNSGLVSPAFRFWMHLWIDCFAVDMFAIFSLRRPDILPCGKSYFIHSSLRTDVTTGDLGVQRGLLRWFLSLHSPSHSFSLSPEKIDQPAKDHSASQNQSQSQDKDALPSFGSQNNSRQPEGPATSADVSSVPPAVDDELQLLAMPTPFTPSINRTLNKVGKKKTKTPLPLPDGLTVVTMKSRLDGKKIKYVLILVKGLLVFTTADQGCYVNPKGNGRFNRVLEAV
jgi:DNA-3-methyladenine glycosylase II